MLLGVPVVATFVLQAYGNLVSVGVCLAVLGLVSAGYLSDATPLNPLPARKF